MKLIRQKTHHIIVNLDIKNTPYNHISTGKCRWNHMSILPTSQLTPIVAVVPGEGVSTQKGITNLYASLDVTQQQSKLNLQCVCPIKSWTVPVMLHGLQIQFKIY